MKIDLILQGPVYSYTGDIIRSYLQHPLTNEVILSCWEGCNTKEVEGLTGLKILKNKDVTYPGIGNLNRQIVSSYSGLKQSCNPYVAKMRTDQIFNHNSLSTMHEFFHKFNAPASNYLDGSQRRSKLFVLGMYSRFPFHPRDHVFWGFREDLIKLFSVPISKSKDEVPGLSKGSEAYWSKVTRPESYLGTWYASLLYEELKPIFTAYEDYLPDTSPFLKDALDLSNKFRDNLFTPFPCIDFSWPKQGLKSYHFNVGKSLSEYWFDEGGDGY